jgi:hypothetical protein
MDIKKGYSIKPFCPTRRFCIHNSLKQFYNKTIPPRIYFKYIKENTIQEFVTLMYYYSQHYCIFIPVRLLCAMLCEIQQASYSYPLLDMNVFIVYKLKNQEINNAKPTGIHYKRNTTIGHIEFCKHIQTNLSIIQKTALLYKHIFKMENAQTQSQPNIITNETNMTPYGIILPMKYLNDLYGLYNFLKVLEVKHYNSIIKDNIKFCIDIIAKWKHIYNKTQQQIMEFNHPSHKLDMNIV